MKIVLIAFLKNKDIVKLNFLQCLDTIAILSPKIWMNEIFS